MLFQSWYFLAGFKFLRYAIKARILVPISFLSKFPTGTPVRT